MGYYTRYDLTYQPRSEEVDEALVYDAIVGNLRCDAKWYSHEKDMEKFSKRFPDVIFELKGDGDDSPDYWVKYFKNGKVKFGKANLVFPTFDELEN